MELRLSCINPLNRYMIVENFSFHSFLGDQTTLSKLANKIWRDLAAFWIPILMTLWASILCPEKCFRYVAWESLRASRRDARESYLSTDPRHLQIEHIRAVKQRAQSETQQASRARSHTHLVGWSNNGARTLGPPTCTDCMATMETQSLGRHWFHLQWYWTLILLTNMW